ncbi:MAG TPA: [protein-PII] uridylyltransferase [Acidimicrobiia bacterium]|nr:[protein-PII] uridylyltransferase [Acidimicrobiia bacterium]
MISGRLRVARAALVGDTALRGSSFGHALADAVDGALKEAFGTLEQHDSVALVALGSYGRRELCPGSDIDVLLLHGLRGRRAAGTVREMTEQLWYPLWDAGFVTGHGARTVKDSVALADDDLDALTALLEVRHIAGDDSLTADLVQKVRDLADRRHERLLRALADAAEVRRLRPGPVAEMLEPDLKDGAGGLRDVQSLGWAGWAFGRPGGTDALIARGYLAAADLERVEAGRSMLLDLRVALQRVTTSRSDRLALQEQDAVATALGYADADGLVRELSSAARDIAWTTGDVWSRVRDGLRGPSGRGARGDRPLAEQVTLREGRVHVDADPDGSVPALRTLEAAAAAAEHDAPFERASLTRLRATADPTWDVWERAAFLRLLRAGANAVPVFEALDHEAVLVRVLPEWEHVRSLPQRNAYHRFTVDRHLLEAVAECAVLLDAGDRRDQAPGDIDGVVARACRRPEILLLGALLHDIAKGRPGDHSELGAETAERFARRIALDSEGREILVWLVRNHLMMAEIATRRDLSDAAVADNVAAACASDPERLRLLYLLTIGDSRATGPAAWSPAKASLVRDLFVKAAAAIERASVRALAADRRQALAERLGEARAHALLARFPETYVLAFDPDQMRVHEELLEHAPTVRCVREDGHVTVTVVARDRPGLLATLAGALTVCGLDVLDANLLGTTDGIALDVFRAADPFGRVEDDGARVADLIGSALAGDLDLGSRVNERRQAYALAGTEPGPVDVVVDNDVSDTDTVVEVHAHDDVGLLYRLASALSDLTIDVRVAKVATLGKRVVDVFYVRGADGRKLQDDMTEPVRAALESWISG